MMASGVVLAHDRSMGLVSWYFCTTCKQQPCSSPAAASAVQHHCLVPDHSGEMTLPCCPHNHALAAHCGDATEPLVHSQTRDT